MSYSRRPSVYAARLLFALALICTLPGVFLRAQSIAEQPSSLMETGGPSKPPGATPAPADIKIVSYNIRWRGGEDLRRLIALLRDDPEIGHAAIIGLQEVDRNRKRTGNVNTPRLMAEQLEMYYAWAAPPSTGEGKKAQEEETGVAILSPYPLTDVRRFVLPHPGPGGRRRAAIGATVRIGSTFVRVYSIHAETRTTCERRLQQFQAVLDDARDYQTKTERVVVLGDFNTLTDKDVDATSKLFTAARYETPFPNHKETWHTFIIKLKLDWLWLRNLRPLEHGIARRIELSDHWPLWATVSLK